MYQWWCFCLREAFVPCVIRETNTIYWNRKVMVKNKLSAQQNSFATRKSFLILLVGDEIQSLGFSSIEWYWGNELVFAIALWFVWLIVIKGRMKLGLVGAKSLNNSNWKRLKKPLKRVVSLNSSWRSEFFGWIWKIQKNKLILFQLHRIEIGFNPNRKVISVWNSISTKINSN